MKDDYQQQFILLAAIRDFFNKNQFIDVLAPPVVSNPGMEPHIHPFQLKRVIEKGETIPYYLHTSPEFYMKELLSYGFDKIFTLSHSFRDEPTSSLHNFQFIMLEWYRSNCRYEKIMDDCENLFKHCYQFFNENSIKTINRDNLKYQRVTIQELFLEYTNIDILNFIDTKSIKELIERDYKDIPVPSDSTLEWDDYYFLLFLNKVEPNLINHPYILLYEFPAPLAALSTIKKDNKKVCERFEIYINGVELCNCFNELCDLEVQKSRFNEQANLKNKIYNYSLPKPTVLYDALDRGIRPSSGIALGVERLNRVLTGTDNPFCRKKN